MSKTNTHPTFHGHGQSAAVGPKGVLELTHPTTRNSRPTLPRTSSSALPDWPLDIHSPRPQRAWREAEFVERKMASNGCRGQSSPRQTAMLSSSSCISVTSTLVVQADVKGGNLHAGVVATNLNQKLFALHPPKQPGTSVTSTLVGRQPSRADIKGRKPHNPPGSPSPSAAATSVTQKLLALQPPSVTQSLANGVRPCGGCKARLTKEHWTVEVNPGQFLCAKCAAYLDRVPVMQRK